MKVFYITGASKGLGKALAESLLEVSGNKVVGISRSHSIKHPGYEAINLDLSDLDAVRGFSFENVKEAEQLVLINNAATLGETRYALNLTPQNTIETYNLNLLAPVLLCNRFLTHFKSHKARKLILNISSGAGQHAVDGWSLYCSSKSALNMYSQVADKEMVIRKENTRIFSISPGLIDTQMQHQIREVTADEFSRHQEFLDYHSEGELTPPEVAAENILKLLEQPDNFKEVLVSFRA